MTTTQTIKGSRVRVGDRIRRNVGGQAVEFTVCEKIESKQSEGGVAVRSTLDTDHVWVHMWVHIGADTDVEVVSFAPATDAEFDV